MKKLILTILITLLIASLSACNEIQGYQGQTAVVRDQHRTVKSVRDYGIFLIIEYEEATSRHLVFSMGQWRKSWGNAE